MVFYDRLKESRIKADLTQEQLAEKSGIAMTDVYADTGASGPDVGLWQTDRADRNHQMLWGWLSVPIGNGRILGCDRRVYDNSVCCRINCIHPEYKKESCFAGFSACGGSRKRHLPFRRSAILAERFHVIGKQFPMTWKIKSSRPVSGQDWRLLFVTRF